MFLELYLVLIVQEFVQILLLIIIWQKYMLLIPTKYCNHSIAKEMRLSKHGLKHHIIALYILEVLHEYQLLKAFELCIKTFPRICYLR